MNDKMALLDSWILRKRLVESRMGNTCSLMDYSLSRKNGFNFANNIKKLLKICEEQEYFCSLSNKETINEMHMKSDLRKPKDIIGPVLDRINEVQRKQFGKKYKSLLDGSELDTGYTKKLGFNLDNTNMVRKIKSPPNKISKACQTRNDLEPFSLQMVPPLEQIIRNMCFKRDTEAFPECFDGTFGLTEMESQLKFEYRKAEFESCPLPLSKFPIQYVKESAEREPQVCKVVQDDTCPGVLKLENQVGNETETFINDSASTNYWIHRDAFFLKLIFGDMSDQIVSDDSFDSTLNDSFDSTSRACFEPCLKEFNNNLDGSVVFYPEPSTDLSTKNWNFGSESSMKQKRRRMDSGVDLSYDAIWNASFTSPCKCENSCEICDGFIKEFEAGLESAKRKKTHENKPNREIEKSRRVDENASRKISGLVVADNACTICRQIVDKIGLVSCEYLFCFECAPVPFGEYTLYSPKEITPSSSRDAKSPGILDCLQSVEDKGRFRKLNVECIATKVLNDWWCQMIWAPKHTTVERNKLHDSSLDYESIFVKGRLYV